MTQFKELVVKSLVKLEDCYLKIMSEPTFSLNPDELRQRGETLREISLDMLKLETAHLSDIQKAVEVEGVRMQEALKAMEEAIQANTDSSTLIYSVDYALDIMKHFVLLL